MRVINKDNVVEPKRSYWQSENVKSLGGAQQQPKNKVGIAPKQFQMNLPAVQFNAMTGLPVSNARTGLPAPIARTVFPGRRPIDRTRRI